MSIYVDIKKNFNDFNLKVQFEAKDEVLSLIGASGCGKSMTLKCISGIIKPDKGKIIVNNKTLFDSERKICLTPQQRHIGFLFQNYGLFPNMTVRQNIKTGIRYDKKLRNKDQIVKEIMGKFGLLVHTHHYPSQLSGGQQQRTALARILISNPEIILLDEPFSALDTHLRFCLEQEIREVIKQFNSTVILVSHNRDEAFRLSEKIAVMNDGKIEVCDNKKNVFANPITLSSALLTGCKNISKIEIINNNYVRALDWGIELQVLAVNGDERFIGLRMNDICYGPGQNTFVCKVIEKIENPFSYILMLRPREMDQGMPIKWEIDKQSWGKIEKNEVEVNFPLHALSLLKE